MNITPDSTFKWSTNLDRTKGNAPNHIFNAVKKTFGTTLNPFIIYYKLSVKVLRSGLKIVVVLYSEMAEKVGRVIASVALCSVSLKFLFHIRSFYNYSKKLEHNYRLSDKEGMAWSAAELLVKPLFIANGFLTFGKSLQTLYGITWIQLFSIAVTPIALGLLCYSTIRRLYRTLMLINEYFHLPTHINADYQKFSEENYIEMVSYIKNKVDVTEKEMEEIREETLQRYKIIVKEKPFQEEFLISPEEKPCGEIFKPTKNHPQLDELEKLANDHFKREIKLLKSRKINRLKRRTDKRIVKYMMATNWLISSPSSDTVKKEKVFAALQDIKKLTIRRLVFDIGKTFFNSMEIGVYFVPGYFPAIITQNPLTITLSKTAFSIFKHIFIDKRMNYGLKNPEFYPPA